MAKYYFLVGSSAAGKSTTERNIRLRMTGYLLPGDHQVATEQQLVFAGRVLFNSGKKVLRFSGGDATGYQWESLLNAIKYANVIKPSILYNRVIFEKYHVPIKRYEELVRAGHDITVFHIEVDPELAKLRLDGLDHPGAFNPHHPYYRPNNLEYQEKRDAQLADIGVQVVYVGGDVRDRCEFIEEYIGLFPMNDYIVYDFKGPVDEIEEKFHAGGDQPRAIEETYKEISK